MNTQKSIKRVFVAGKLSNTFMEENRTPSKVITDYLSNCHKMCATAIKLIKYGFVPFTPCLDMLLGLVSGNLSEEEYRKVSFEFLKVCDAVLVISLSQGVLEEIKLAQELNIPIYYSINDLLVDFVRSKEEKDD